SRSKSAYDWGAAALKRGDYREAVRALDLALELEPGDAEAHLCRGRAHHALKNHNAALADYAEAVRLDPDRADAYAARARLRNERREYREAFDDGTRALERNATHAEARQERAFAANELGWYDWALGDLNEVIRLNDRDARAYANRAFAHTGKKEKALALRDAEKAAELEPNNPLHHTVLAGLRDRNEDALAAAN